MSFFGRGVEELRSQSGIEQAALSLSHAGFLLEFSMAQTRITCEQNEADSNVCGCNAGVVDEPGYQSKNRTKVK